MSRTDLAAVSLRTALVIDDAHAGTWLQYAILADNISSVERAEKAYRRALSIDPNLTDASFGLGLLYLKALRFEESVASLRKVVTQGGADAFVYISLGHALYMASRFSESAEAYEMASTFGPLEGNSLRRYARARTFATMIEGDIGRALADYPALAGSEAETIDEITRDGFGLFSAYGYKDAALAIGQLRLSVNPEDPIQQHLNNAVAGSLIDSVPNAYVEAYFDSFAAGFDEKLVGVLKYQVPRDLAGLIGGHRSTFSHMLDLGCGTGLAGEFLAGFGKDLVGVDLSTQMLAHAEERQTYSRVVKSEAVDFLHAHPVSFDLVFAADLLIYFGRIEELIAAVAQAMTSGGIFAASIELADNDDYELLPSGRFAHAESYLASLTAPYFDNLEQRRTELRLEAGVAVMGALFVLRRKDL